MVVWLDDRVPSTQVRVTRLLAGSQTWEASRLVSDTAAVPVALALGVSSDGSAFAVWQDARGTSYDIWGADYDVTTNTWAAPTLVSDDPGATAQMRPTVARSATEVATAWRDDRVSGGDIRSRRRATAQGVDHFTYAYDGLNRLLSATGPVPESFSFDGATNVTSRTGPSATNSYDTANRQTSDGTRSFTWSPADRLTQRGADTFIYDPLGRLTSSTVAGTTRAYAFNGDGLLSSAAGTTYLWDVGTTPAALLQAGTDKVIDGLGALYAVRADGSTYTFARDGLGSVRAELTTGGSTTKSVRYAAYGGISQTTGGSPTLLGFASELFDSSGLLYLRARWYDPGTGRFMSTDPNAGSASAPVTLNVFAYASADPVLNTDPSGRFCIPCVGAIIGAGASFAGYWATTAATHQEFRWDQALIATGAGAISGAACTGGVIAGCIAVSAAVSTIQYGLAPGEKSVLGYAASAASGALIGRWTFTKTIGGPYFSGPLSWSKALRDDVGIGFDVVKSLTANFFRSATANALANLGLNAFADGAAGADIGSGPSNGSGGTNK